MSQKHNKIDLFSHSSEGRCVEAQSVSNEVFLLGFQIVAFASERENFMVCLTLIVVLVLEAWPSTLGFIQFYIMKGLSPNTDDI